MSCPRLNTSTFIEIYIKKIKIQKEKATNMVDGAICLLLKQNTFGYVLYNNKKVRILS